MATQITASLPTLDFPLEADYPTQEDWAAFSAAAEENFGILGGSWSEQMQLWKEQANAMSIESNTNSTIAQGLANYQGDWVSQGYTLGQTVSIGEVYYICKLTHSTGQNPTDVSSLYWNLALGNWSLKADKTEVALKIDKDISPYSSKPTPIDLDLVPLSDSASSFGIKKLSWANLKATLKTYFDTLYVKFVPTIMTGTVSFNAVTNEASGTNIGVGVEIGDVILFSGATDSKNNSEFTVEVINNANSIIVNQAHANRGTTKNVATRVNNNGVTVKLLNKYYNAPLGQGQGLINMTSFRTSGVTYPNNLRRDIQSMIAWTGPVNTSPILVMNSNTFTDLGGTYNLNGVYVKDGLFINLEPGTYLINANGGTINSIWERR